MLQVYEIHSRLQPACNFSDEFPSVRRPKLDPGEPTFLGSLNVPYYDFFL